MTQENQEKKTKKNKKQKRGICVPANKKGRHVTKTMNILRFIMIPFIWLLFPYKYYGNKKVKDGACVYICNHYRIWDVVYPAGTTTENIHFLAKNAVVKNKFLSFFCRKVGVINVNRDGNDVRAAMDSMKCLKNNEKISLFPEGTRNKTKEEMLPFHSGASVMAIRAKVPIIPMLIYKKTKPFRLNHILIGEPFELTEYYDRKMTDEMVEEADKFLFDKLISMRREHAEFLANKKKRKN